MLWNVVGIALMSAGGGTMSEASTRFNGRPQGAVFNFADDHFFEATGHYGSVRIKDSVTPGNNYDGVPYGKITNTSPSHKICRGPNGLFRFQAHNLFLNSAAPATQSIAVLVGATYTVSLTGSGSITLSNAGSGVVTAGSPVTFTAGTVTLTCTVSGSPTTAHVRRTPSDDKYLATSGAAEYDLPFTWDANGRLRGIRRENAITTLALHSRAFDNAAWVKTDISVSANAGADITGEIKADRLTASAGNGTVVQHLQASSSNAARLASVYAKRFGPGNGAVTLEMGASSTAMSLTTEWQRFAVFGAGVTGTYSATAGAYTVTVTAHGLNTGDSIRFDATSGSGEDASIANITVSDANTITFTNGSVTSSGNCTVYPNTMRIKIATSGDAIEVCFGNANVPATANVLDTTSPVETFALTVARAGDNISILTSALPLSATEMTLGGCWEISRGSNPHVEIQAANRADALTQFADHIGGSLYTGSGAAFATQHQILHAVMANSADADGAGVFNRMSGSSQANDFRTFRNAVQAGAGPDTSGSFQATAYAKLCFSSIGNGLSVSDTILEEIFYFPEISTDAELRALCVPTATDEIANSIHLLGDSFLADVNIPQRLMNGLDNKRRTITTDGVGGTTLAQQKIRYDATPEFYRQTLVIVDGGHTDDLASAQEALQSILSHLTHDRWLLVEGGYNIAERAAGLPLRGTIDAFYAWIVSTYGASHFCPTLDYLQTFSIGDAGDLADLAADVVPRSQTTDGLHLSTASGGGFDNFTHQIIEKILDNDW